MGGLRDVAGTYTRSWSGQVLSGVLLAIVERVAHRAVPRRHLAASADVVVVVVMQALRACYTACKRVARMGSGRDCGGIGQESANGLGTWSERNPIVI